MNEARDSYFDAIFISRARALHLHLVHIHFCLVCVYVCCCISDGNSKWHEALAFAAVVVAAAVAAATRCRDVARVFISCALRAQKRNSFCFVFFLSFFLNFSDWYFGRICNFRFFLERARDNYQFSILVPFFKCNTVPFYA